MRNLGTALQQARDAHPRLRALLLWRERASELERAVELLQAEAKLGLDVARAEDVEQQAETSLALAVSGQRINLMVAFFLPLTALAAVFGMNLDSGLDPHASVFFWSLLAFGLVLGAGLLIRLRDDAAPKRRRRGR